MNANNCPYKVKITMQKNDYLSGEKETIEVELYGITGTIFSKIKLAKPLFS